jgi:hypothetical protein
LRVAAFLYLLLFETLLEWRGFANGGNLPFDASRQQQDRELRVNDIYRHLGE